MRWMVSLQRFLNWHDMIRLIRRYCQLINLHGGWWWWRCRWRCRSRKWKLESDSTWGSHQGIEINLVIGLQNIRRSIVTVERRRRIKVLQSHFVHHSRDKKWPTCQMNWFLIPHFELKSDCPDRHSSSFVVIWPWKFLNPSDWLWSS